jgi:uncharacterized protein
MSSAGHVCPGADPVEAAELISRLRREAWLLRALTAAAASGLPDAWVGAGAIMDVVWGQLHGGFEPSDVADIDVAYFDPGDLSRARDRAAQAALAERADLPWEATNQAAVHTWYHQYFGGPAVQAFASVHEAVATWPETATCVAVRLASGGFEVCAPHGLGDLLAGLWRVNPVRVTAATSAARLARQRDRRWWPAVTVVPPGG